MRDGNNSTSINTDVSGSVTAAIVTAISERTGTDVDELGPLYNSIDPDALNSLLNHSESDKISIEFTYEEHTITIENTGMNIKEKE